MQRDGIKGRIAAVLLSAVMLCGFTFGPVEAGERGLGEARTQTTSQASGDGPTEDAGETEDIDEGEHLPDEAVEDGGENEEAPGGNETSGPEESAGQEGVAIQPADGPEENEENELAAGNAAAQTGVPQARQQGAGAPVSPAMLDEVLSSAMEVSLYDLTAGQLENEIVAWCNARGILPEEITSLTVTGRLNTDDLNYIWQGSTSRPNSTGSLPALDTLDLSAAVQEEAVLPASQFAYHPALREVKLPGNITSIENKAFYYCFALERVDLGSLTALATIGWYAFDNCRALDDVTLPDSLKSLGQYSFNCCYELSSITLPAGLTTLGYASFKSTGITRADLSACNALTFLDSDMFQFCSKLAEVLLPASLQSIGNSAFHGAGALRDIDLSHMTGLTKIGTNTFYGSGLVSVDLSSNTSLTSLGPQAFGQCYSLRRVTMPDTDRVVTMGYKDAFIGINEYWDTFTVTVLVPDAMVGSYKANYNWKNSEAAKNIKIAGYGLTGGTLQYEAQGGGSVVPYWFSDHYTNGVEVFEGDSFWLEAIADTYYTFTGWTAVGADPGASTKVRQSFTVGNTGDVTITAMFVPTEFGIAYRVDGGTNDPANPTSYTVEDTPITLLAPTKPGHDFKGWYGNADFTGSAMTEIPAGSGGELVLFAKWVKTAYAVTTLPATGGTVTADKATATIDEKVTLEIVPAKGYRFAGLDVTPQDLMVNVTQNTGSGYTGWFTMPAGAVTVQGVFEPVPMEDLIEDATLAPGPFVYSGAPHEPGVSVTFVSGVSLTMDEDYTVTYLNNTDAGTASAVITGINGYAASGSYSLTFPIGQAAPQVDEWPTAAAAVPGDTLGEIKFTAPGEVVDVFGQPLQGAFSWREPDTVLTQDGDHPLSFVPDDANYKAVERTVRVLVNDLSLTVTGTPAVGDSFCLTVAPATRYDTTGDEGWAYDSDKLAATFDDGWAEFAPVLDGGYTITYTNSLGLEASATVTVAKGVMSGISAEGYEGPFDGVGHSIEVTGVPAGATVEYSTDGGSTWQAVNPAFTDIGTEAEVHYRVTKPGYETVAGSAWVRVGECGHSWGAWQIVTEATCEEAGERSHTCTICGEPETEPLPPKGHDWGKWAQTKAPTTTKEGEERRVCANCGEVEIRTVAKLPDTSKPGSSSTSHPGSSSSSSSTPVISGLPTAIRVGDRFTLTPADDTRSGSDGWAWDSQYFSATFNSPATFTALKEGDTTITYTAADGSKVELKLTIASALETSPSSTSSTSGNAVAATGDRAGNVIALVLVALAALAACTALVFVRRKRSGK